MQTADVETSPTLQIASLSTQAGSEANASARGHGQIGIQLCARNAAASGISHRSSGSMLHSGQVAFQHIGGQLPQVVYLACDVLVC